MGDERKLDAHLNDRDRRGPAPWEPIKVSYLGDVGDVLEGGGGKVTSTPTDPGEPRKTQPSEGA